MILWRSDRLRLRLRTKFLLAMLAIPCALTLTTLLVVRQVMEMQVRRQITADLDRSIDTFERVKQQREAMQVRTVQLLASQPTLKALMTTRDAATIRDGARDFWPLSGGDLMVLADRGGRVVAIEGAAGDAAIIEIQTNIDRALQTTERTEWWHIDTQLYEVFIAPIYFGSPQHQSLLGYVLIGDKMDAATASEVSGIADGEVVFKFGGQVVVSTLSTVQLGDFRSLSGNEGSLDGEKFLIRRTALQPRSTPPLQFIVLKSYDQATRVLSQLNRSLLLLGILAVLIGSVLVFVLTQSYTQPLDQLVKGVRAAEQGDFSYPLNPRDGDEVGEVMTAFELMRGNLQAAQQQLLETERLATIGRMASSISHDLRHPLTAILANAEFLSEAKLTLHERDLLYGEIRIAVNQMTELIDSLLELSRTREALHPTLASLNATIHRAIETIRVRPEFQRAQITVRTEGEIEARFDPRSMVRAFYNLLLNACEAARPREAEILVAVAASRDRIDVRVSDNGTGIPAEIRTRLFQPFVASGKENGVGLGLTIVQKILQDHGGAISVEKTSAEGTTFLIEIPLRTPLEAPSHFAWKSKIPS